MNNLHTDELNRTIQKLREDKLENDIEVLLSNALKLETAYANYLHAISLPTVGEIYCELGLQVLKYAVGIGCFLLIWLAFSHMMDLVFS